MKSENEALRECPFCDGKAVRKEDPGVIGVMYGLVVDHKPGCFLALRNVETDEQIDAAWNRRPQPAEQDEPGRIVAWLKNEAAKWRRYPSELNEQWNQQDEMRAMECERLAYSVQRGDHLK